MNQFRTFAVDNAPADFGQNFVRSDAFRALFREGMLLVEETASYLDGPGRGESRALERTAALTFASESMRLTTRLMQIAAWLLVQRAGAEGEITTSQAREERRRVTLVTSDQPQSVGDVDAMPERLRELIGLSLRLHARLIHLDTLIGEARESAQPAASPVAAQHGLLRMAFGG